MNLTSFQDCEQCCVSVSSHQLHEKQLLTSTQLPLVYQSKGASPLLAKQCCNALISANVHPCQ
jgi:hypothetical protein